jgi:hypothetical protein
VYPPPIFSRCFALARAHGARVGLTVADSVEKTPDGPVRQLGELRIEAGDQVIACAPASDIECGSLSLIEQMGWA